MGILTDCRNGSHDLAQLQLVQDRGLSGRVEADHQNAHLLLAPKAIEQLGECETHPCGDRVDSSEFSFLWRGVRSNVILDCADVSNSISSE